MKINEEKLKSWLYVSWRMGSIGTNDSEEWDKAAFEEWYTSVRDIILSDTIQGESKALENMAKWILENKRNSIFINDLDISIEDKEAIMTYFGYSTDTLR